MTLEITKWDPARHIHDDEDARTYLEEASREGSAEEIVDAIDTVARARGLTELAKAIGVPRDELLDILGEIRPNTNKLAGVLARLGVETHSAKKSDAA